MERANSIRGNSIASMAVLLLSAGQVTVAKVLDENATIAGMSLQYKVVLPKDYDADKAYPAVLALPPGDQGMDMVQFTLIRNWAAEAQRRGYIVVIPSAPNGRPFTREGVRVFPEFLEKLLRDYKIKDNKFHIAGMSNGGLSAFHVAASYPQFFSTVTGFPGYLPDASPERVKALAGMCIHMHVGEMDTRWRDAMQQQAADFRANGLAVQFTVEQGEPHVIGALNDEGAVRLFKEMEEAGPCR
jgi:poly(3-hydroxybutyrate) depolymerase